MLIRLLQKCPFESKICTFNLGDWERCMMGRVECRCLLETNKQTAYNLSSYRWLRLKYRLMLCHVTLHASAHPAWRHQSLLRSFQWRWWSARPPDASDTPPQRHLSCFDNSIRHNTLRLQRLHGWSRFLLDGLAGNCGHIDVGKTMESSQILIYSIHLIFNVGSTCSSQPFRPRV